MAFSNHLNILPDPNNAIGNAGETGGTAGPGFASVQLTSDQPTMRDFTNSGRLLARAIARHQWKVNISYNPMTETEFNRVYSFLLHRRGGVNPFFVSLPQYRTPQDSTFATYAASNNLEAIASYAAGTTQVIISKTGYNNSGVQFVRSNKYLRFSYLFTFLYLYLLFGLNKHASPELTHGINEVLLRECEGPR